MSDTVTLSIDGQSVTVKKGTLLVEAAKKIGTDVPVFCYHEKLKPVGACRMCLVEIEKMPRLQTACTTPVAEGMVVKTQSELAKGGQNSVIALLLANHPLDCPVCDKGGECPLQDNTFGHGLGVSKFEEEKRHNDKAFELSEHIVLDRERCILCYRCVRFHEEIPGDRALAVLDRGGHGEIGILAGDVYDSPFQGNTIDICPVGALTSRQYRFRSRPWDLNEAKSIACDDPTGTNIWVDTRDGRVLRLRPRANAAINDVWMADSTRFGSMPTERAGRLGKPLVRTNGALVETTWTEALRVAAELSRVDGKRPSVVVAPTVSSEAMGAASLIGDVSAVWQRAPSGTKGSIASVATSKSIVLVGLDPWTEMPMLALWIHRAVANTAAGPGGANLVVVDEQNGLHHDSKHHKKTSRARPDTVRAALTALVDEVERGVGAGADLKARPTTLLWGEAVDADPACMALVTKLATLLDANGSGGLVGCPGLSVNAKGAALVTPARTHALASVVVGDAFSQGFAPAHGAHVVWLTHSLPKDLSSAAIPACVDVVLPLAHPYEQAGSYVSLEGRTQGFDAAGIAPGEAKSDWLAVASLAVAVGVAVPQELVALRNVLAERFPDVFGALGKNRTRARAELNVVTHV